MPYWKMGCRLKGILWDRRWIVPSIRIFSHTCWFVYRNAFLIMKLSNPPTFRAIRALIASQSTFEIYTFLLFFCISFHIIWSIPKNYLYNLLSLRRWWTPSGMETAEWDTIRMDCPNLHRWLHNTTPWCNVDSRHHRSTDQPPRMCNTAPFYNLKREGEKQYWSTQLWHNFYCGPAQTYSRLSQKNGKRCNLGPIHSSSVWQNKIHQVLPSGECNIPCSWRMDGT